MSEKLSPQQLRDSPDLEHVETYKVSPEAQAQLDREYIRFLELRSKRIEKACADAKRWLDLVDAAAGALDNARKLLSEVDKEFCQPRVTEPEPSERGSQGGEAGTSFRRDFN